MEKEQLLARYEARGDERDFAAARELYERALAAGADAAVLTGYGYLLECHGRNELRRAAEQYERAIALDPGADRPHHQLISARAGLQEPEWAIAEYDRRLAETPADVRAHRLAAAAHLAGHDYGRAQDVADAGLRLAPSDAALLRARGDAAAGLGDPDAALADWRRALELEPDDIAALYSTAFLHERRGRAADALAAWTQIIAWCEDRGAELDAEWPRREAERLRLALAGR